LQQAGQLLSRNETVGWNDVGNKSLILTIIIISNCNCTYFFISHLVCYCKIFIVLVWEDDILLLLLLLCFLFIIFLLVFECSFIIVTIV